MTTTSVERSTPTVGAEKLNIENRIPDLIVDKKQVTQST